ncbi:MAG: hypothetical protein JOZ49_21275, partial [Mycolicibacterium sp.]|nr:hypothetical protein [Mycolicibacterium sp.]
MTDGAGDPVASVDALVAAIHPGVADPGVQTRDAVLVTGPWLAGSTSLVAALRQRVPEQSFVEAGQLTAEESPLAVVFVASAAAPLTDADCALLDAAAANTDLVIGAVSKIDVRPNWRDVLATDRAALSEHDPRYRDVAWVGVAAAPELGEPTLDELVGNLRHGLADEQLGRRNRLRAWQNRLRGAVRRHDEDAAGVGREARIVALRGERNEMLRREQLASSERTIGLRTEIEQAKEQLTQFARNRCASVRGELEEDASQMTRRRVPAFDDYVRGRVDEVVSDVSDGVTKHLSDLATERGLKPPDSAPAPQGRPVPPPSLKSRRRMMWLATLLGAAIGAGIALALTVAFGITPLYTVAGLTVGALVAALAVYTRGLLHDRSVLNRWIAEIIEELRALLEGHVADRVQSAETALSAEQAERDEAESADLADRVAGIDAELREHAVAGRRAATLRSRELPPLQRALAAVQAELGGSAAGTPASGTST